MAVTKIWRIKGRADSAIDYASDITKTRFTDSERQALADVIEYAANEDKTENRIFVSGVNCSTLYAKDQFNTTKKRFGKDGGTVAFHAYQSFAEGEATPKEAHDIGIALANELWGDSFQVVIATHLNTKCLHNHFVINSVSFKDGKRFHSTAESYRQMREVSDRLCKEYGLSIVAEPKSRGKSYRQYQLEKAGMPTRYTVAKKALDEAIKGSTNLLELKARINSMGYQCQLAPNRKYWTITMPGWKQPIRTYRLGDEYSREAIEKRIALNSANQVKILRAKESYKQRPQYSLKRRIDKIASRSGIEKLYLRYCYELGYLPKYNQRPTKVHKLLKDELLKCEMYSNEAKLLSRMKITTHKELADYKAVVKEKIKTLEDDRYELRLTAKRKVPDEVKRSYKEKISHISNELKVYRNELKLIEDIEERSPHMEDKLKQIDKERIKEVQR